MESELYPHVSLTSPRIPTPSMSILSRSTLFNINADSQVPTDRLENFQAWAVDRDVHWQIYFARGSEAQKRPTPKGQSSTRCPRYTCQRCSRQRGNECHTIPPSKLEAAGKPRFRNIASVTRGNTPPRTFRPSHHRLISHVIPQNQPPEILQNDCAAIAELAYRWYVSAR